MRSLGRGDLNALRTFSQVLADCQEGGVIDLNQAPEFREFARICFSPASGTDMYLNQEGEWVRLPPREHSFTFYRIRALALTGRSVISEPYFSPALKQQVILYALPLYQSRGKVSGVLLAYRSMQTLSEQFTQLHAPKNKVRLYLVSRRGRIIAGSDDALAPYQKRLTIKDLYPLTPADENLLQAALNDSASVDLQVEDERGVLTLKNHPVHFGGWNLVCVSAFELSAAPFFAQIMMFSVLLCAVLFTALVVNGIIWDRMLRSCRRQISLSFYDPLTLGWNLLKFTLELSGQKWRRTDIFLCAVNVRGFRYLNEYVGARAGDDLLKLIHARIKELPEAEMFCREMSDQFYILLRAPSAEAAKPILMQLFNSISTDFKEHSAAFTVVLYAGVISLNTPENAEDLLHRVQLVLRTCRKRSIHSVALFSDKIYAGEQLRLQLQEKLQPALEHGEFKLYLQPKVDLRSGKVCSAEALVRWQQPDGGVLCPGQFVPILEQSGLCPRLDLYMLEQVCAFLQQAQQERLPPLRISVNQCRQLLFYPDYFSRVCGILERYQVPANQLIIEILEEVAASDLPQLNAALSKMRQLGVGIAIDDFGNGCSSLYQLGALQCDELKFDKAFLLEKDPERKAKNKVVLQHFQALAEALSITTVSEGVESAEDAVFLQQAGINVAQGYYYGKPVTASEFKHRFMRCIQPYQPC